MEKRVFEVKVSSRGQMVIPKPLRDRYDLKKGSKVKIIATQDGMMIKMGLKPPWTGLRGLMEEWRGIDLDRLIHQARKSMFKKEWEVEG